MVKEGSEDGSRTDRAVGSNVAKVYCTKCDLIFESRRKFEQHVGRHSSNSTDSIVCETCPIDAAIARLVSFFRPKKHGSDDIE